MTGPGIAGQIVDGRVTDAKLDELLALQVERAEMDFKRLIDPSGTRGMVELAKDVGAMSVLGGYLIGGVDGQGAPTGEMDQCRPEVFDEANLVPKLAKYLPEPITISSRVTVRDGHTLVLIYIAPHPNGYAVFHTDGQYRDSKDRIRITFRRGEAFWRAGTRSERITQSGMEQIIQRRVAEARRVWVEEQQSIRAREREELRGRDASRSPLGTLNVDLPARELQVTALELLRVNDRIALQHLLIDAVSRARALIVSDTLGDLGGVLDKVAGLGAIFLQYRQVESFDEVVETLATIYSVPLETTDDRNFGMSVSIDPKAVAPRVFLLIMERVYALGGLAVRLGRWEAISTLGLQTPERVDDYYPNWLRHGLTTAARANQFDVRADNGQATSTSLITLAAAVVAREATVRPDGVDDESVLTSIVQFDLLANLSAIDGAGSTESRVFFTNWARFRQGRVQPIADRVITDPKVREAVFSHGDNSGLAIAFDDMAKLALSEGNRFDGFSGWQRTPVGEFVQRNLPTSRL